MPHRSSTVPPRNGPSAAEVHHALTSNDSTDRCAFYRRDEEADGRLGGCPLPPLAYQTTTSGLSAAICSRLSRPLLCSCRRFLTQAPSANPPSVRYACGTRAWPYSAAKVC